MMNRLSENNPYINPLLEGDMARKDNRLICYIHDDVMALCETIKEDLTKKVPPSIIKQKLDRIVRLTERAKSKGQQMEDRLSKYREAIEEVGFERKK